MSDAYRITVPPELKIDPAPLSKEIESFIADRVKAFHRDGAVLGLSGGIDSAVVAALSVRALGPEKVLALIMPERDSSPSSEQHAMKLAGQLGIRTERIDLTGVLSDMGVYQRLQQLVQDTVGMQQVMEEVRRFVTGQTRQPPFRFFMQGTDAGGGLPRRLMGAGRAFMDVKHRLRMVTWYYWGEMENLLVLGGCNRTETEVGFFVKYGDAGADVAPIDGLYKTQVFQLGRYLNIPEEILSKAPSPDLLPGVTDEAAMGISYETLDRILIRMQRQLATEAIAHEVGVDKELVEYVMAMNRASAHMREQAEVGPTPPSGGTRRQAA